MGKKPDTTRFPARALKITFLLFYCFGTSQAQPGYTANDFGAFLPYTGIFQYGTNMGYFGPSWDNVAKANIATGNTALQVKGAGAFTYRVPLPEDFLEYWGYDIELSNFQHYQSLGVQDNTVFVGSPSAAHTDNASYDGCGISSRMFANMYEDIWDGGANGTPVNDNNYYALYLYKTVTRYKNYVKFWEIMNEPDYDISGTAWMEPGQPGNWWDNNPPPCALSNMRAPIYHYVRMLRISYEVIKSIDPNAYITVGGIGYPAFLDALLRNTDNPVDGTVSAAYPLGGGAYFDVLSYHNYPMYSLRYWDNGINNFAYKRHSDAAATEFLKVKDAMATVLENYGYNNSGFPAKHFICTENNIPRKEFGDYIGSDLAQLNYIIKALVGAQQKQIRQYYIFVLGDAQTLAAATDAYEVMGLYQKLEGVGPLTNGGVYGQQYTNEGIAFKTCSDLLRNYRYDSVRTQNMNLPGNIGGAAFGDGIGNYVYSLWAKTTVDKSESATATYTFPAAMSVAPLLYRRAWDYSQTAQTQTIPSSNIALTGTPVFLAENFQIVAIQDRDPQRPEDSKKVELSIFPNPSSQGASLRFTLTAPSRIALSLWNARGQFIKKLGDYPQLQSGTHVIALPELAGLPGGAYYLQFETGKTVQLKKLLIAR